MIPPDLLAAARRQQSPRDLERFLDEACGGDRALREELLRQLAVPDTTLPAEPMTGEYGSLGSAAVFAAALEAMARGDTAGPAGEIDVQVGDLLADRFRIREKIGRGGMGAVFAADQVAPVERRVAVKVIKAGMDSAQVVARFAQERQVLALMDHPNVARIHDGGVTRLGRPFFVMELVHGLPLTQFCDQERLSVRQRVELFIPVCRAVQHAHQKGVIHRDLKSSNILVTRADGKPTAKVIDFGVAKVMQPGLTDAAVYTQHGAVIGTLEYMAPEQAALTGLDIDTRADVYSLGVILYELLCGGLPLSRQVQLRGSLDEIVRTIREVEPQKPSTRVSSLAAADPVAARRQVSGARLRRQLRGDLDWVVMKCLEKERDRRYDTAAALAADLERYLRGEPVLAAPPSTGYRVQKFLRRHAGRVAAASLGLLLLAAAAVIATVGWVRAARAERLARDEAAIHRALVGFIQHDLFDSIDPTERARMGLPIEAYADVQLRPLLDRVARQVDDGRLADQPLVEAALRQTLARGYIALGRNAEALAHAARADDLRAAHLGPQHRDRLETLETIGDARQGADDREGAVAALEQALQLRRQLDGDDHRRTLKVRYALTVLARGRGRTAEAEERQRELLAHQRRVLGPDHEDTLRTQRSLADGLVGRAFAALPPTPELLGEAEPLLVEALAAGRRRLGPEHPGPLGSQNSLAHLYRLKNDLARSEELYRDLLTRAGKVYPADHPLLAVYKANLAVCLQSQGKYPEAAALLGEVQPVFERIGPRHRLTLVMKSNLAAVLASQSKHAEASALYDALMPLFAETFGPAGPPTRNLMISAADNRARQGQRAEAVAILTKLLRAQREQSPRNSADMYLTANRLAAQLLKLGDARRAEAVLADVLAELPAADPNRVKIQQVLDQVRAK